MFAMFLERPTLTRSTQHRSLGRPDRGPWRIVDGLWCAPSRASSGSSAPAISSAQIIQVSSSPYSLTAALFHSLSPWRIKYLKTALPLPSLSCLPLPSQSSSEVWALTWVSKLPQQGTTDRPGNIEDGLKKVTLILLQQSRATV